MDYVENLSQLSNKWQKFNKPILTIGNFDGFHLGHQKLFIESKAQATKTHSAWGALTFDPHPREYFSGAAQDRLFSPLQKRIFFERVGAGFLCVQAFDGQFAETSTHSFLRLLRPSPVSPGIGCVIVGQNFYFGKNREGDVNTITSWGKTMGVNVVIVDPIHQNGQIISSSNIKKLIKHSGDMPMVTAALGRHYCVEGHVIRGKQIGRSMGFPTANISGVTQLLPEHGVYSGYFSYSNTNESLYESTVYYPAVINIGFNPTVSSTPRATHFEAHLLADNGFGEDQLYGKNCLVYFVERLREERHFASLALLRDQIQLDCQRARDSLGINPLKRL